MSKLRKFLSALRDIVYGATVYPVVEHVRDEFVIADMLFLLAVFGDMVGLPVSSYYRLRLLPYVMPRFKAWKVRVLAEKDVV